MTQKTLGYVKLEWTCRRCGGKNPGPEKLCIHCGASMDEQDRFELPETQEFVTDAEELKKAAAGPDIHCPYCETRNPAGSTICSQCGGDLREGYARPAGRVMDSPGGRHAATSRSATTSPPSKGTTTSPSRRAHRPPTSYPSHVGGREGMLSPTLLRAGLTALIAVMAIACIVGCYFLFFKTHDEGARATGTHFWSRTTKYFEVKMIEHEDWEEDVPDNATIISHRREYRETVDYEPYGEDYETSQRQESGTAWRDEVPDEASIGSCSSEHRYTSDTKPVGGEYTEVCGTPYTIDQGSGYGKVVQDCEYEVYEDKCSYTITITEYKVYGTWVTYKTPDWVYTGSQTTSGTDLNPYWAKEINEPANPTIGSKKSERGSEIYQCGFRTEEKEYKDVSVPLEYYKQCREGDKWILKVNAVGGVRSVEPAE